MDDPRIKAEEPLLCLCGESRGFVRGLGRKIYFARVMAFLVRFCLVRFCLFTFRGRAWCFGSWSLALVTLWFSLQGPTTKQSLVDFNLSSLRHSFYAQKHERAFCAPECLVFLLPADGPPAFEAKEVKAREGKARDGGKIGR